MPFDPLSRVKDSLIGEEKAKMLNLRKSRTSVAAGLQMPDFMDEGENEFHPRRP
jgi:hypothetical protein